jgi:hypothetical protein
MVEPFIYLPALGLVGLTPSAVIFGMRVRDGRRWASELIPYRVEVPSGCDPVAVARFLGSMTGLLPSRWSRSIKVRGLAFETVASASGLDHILLVPKRQIDIVVGQLRASLPNVRLTPDPEYRLTQPTLAGEVVTAQPHHQLNVDDPASVATSILAALQPLEGTERITVQWIVLPLPPGTSPPTDVGRSVWSELLGTAKPERTPQQDQAIRTKYTSPIFVVASRLAVTTESPARDRQLLARLTASLHAANSADATLRRRPGGSRSVAQDFLRRRPPLYSRPCLLNARELSGLVALPPPNVSLPGMRLGGSRLLPPSTDVPSTGIIVGDANFPGVDRPIALSVVGSQQHLHVVGPPGTGKSVLLLNMAIQIAEAGHGLIVLDPKRDLVEDLLDRIPTNRQDDVVVFDPLDNRPVGLATLQSVDGDSDLAAEQLFAIIHKLNKDSWGPRLADLLRAALHTLAQTEGATLCELPVLLTDSAYRAKVIGNIDDPLGLSAVWAWFDSLSEGERSQASAPILNKARPWVVRPRLRHVLGQSKPLLDLDTLLSERQILLVPLSSGQLGDDASALLASVLVTKLSQAIMRRVRLPRSERHPAWLLIDEAQILGKLPTPLAEMLALARGMAVSVTMANQVLSQFDPELREAVLGAARSRVIFQTGSADATRFARELGPSLGAEDLQGLRPYEVVASLSTGERVAPPVTGRTRPAPPSNGQADAIRERSRQRWGRDRNDIEADLRRRLERPKVAGPVGRQRRAK